MPATSGSPRHAGPPPPQQPFLSLYLHAARPSSFSFPFTSPHAGQAPHQSQPPVAARASTRSLPRGIGALPESAPASLRFSVGRRCRAARRRATRLEVKASGNTFGNYFQAATYGESHGGGVGCVISGCPPRIPLSEADMQVELDRRLVPSIHVSSGGQSVEQPMGGAERAGFKAIALTVDTPCLGRREVDIKNRFVLPPHLKNFEGLDLGKMNQVKC